MLSIFTGTIVVYFFAWYLTGAILMNFQFYTDRDAKSRIVWRNLALNNVNNCIAITWAMYNMTNGCPEYGWVGWFKSDVCFLRPYVGIAYSIAYMNGFLVFDFLCIYFIFPSWNKLNHQMMLHHVMAVGGYSFSILAGYGVASCSSASLLCEVSSLFLNYKDMFTKENKDSAIAQVN